MPPKGEMWQDVWLLSYESCKVQYSYTNGSRRQWFKRALPMLHVKVLTGWNYI